ncbi:MAG: hypothetical protein IJ696_07260 [Ruminococcus sp.]|nr:hypothetical protein [Ruminococcus sp.]
MKTGGISGFQPIMRTHGQTAEKISADTSDTQMPDIKDKVDISPEGMERYRESISEVSGEQQTTDEVSAMQIETAGEQTEQQEETESEKVGTSMGINSGKLARMLAAAKTKSQIRSVIALIQSDIRECDSGKAQGAEVDEASYKAAQQLLEQAKSRMNTADDREPTPEEEMAQSIASLM